MKKCLIKFLKDKDLLKDFFTGIGYFVFVAGVTKLVWPSVLHESWWVKLSTASIIFILLYIAFLFWAIHVVRPSIQIYSPKFGLPEIDDGVPKMSIIEIIKRLDIWLFIFILIFSLQVGWYVIESAVFLVKN